MGCFAAVDFCKAYYSVDHEYAKAFFSAIGLSPDLSSLLLHLFKSPYILNVAGRIDTTQKITSGAGVRQGDPLSPALFCLFTAPAIFELKKSFPGLKVLMYADDLLIYIPAPPATCVAAMNSAFKSLHHFSLFSGLKVNLGKSALFINGPWNKPEIDALSDLGIQLKDWVRYLGIPFSHVSPDAALNLQIPKAMHRAHTLSTLSLTLSEKISLLQQWILPLFILPVKAYPLTPHTISLLTTIYNTSLGTNSWGLLHNILALKPQER